MTAGPLRQRFAFDERVIDADGYGNERGTWVERFRVWAQRMMLRGGEDVLAARLEGRAPAVIVVRATTDARRVTTDWRARDLRSGQVFNVRAVTPRERRDYLDFLCETGVADG
jgi:SPP1 family predicted phage head-tail adaptor